MMAIVLKAPLIFLTTMLILNENASETLKHTSMDDTQKSSQIVQHDALAMM